MIKEAIEKWELNKEKVLEYFSKKHPEDYREIVKILIENITSDAYEDFCPDPERIHEICCSDAYSGDFVYVIAEKGYSPNSFFYTIVSYGSCSGCDTLLAIKYNSSNYDDSEIPSADQAKQYQNLALHILQNLKEMV